MAKSSHYEITAQYDEGNSNEIDENVRNLIVGSFMPRKQEIKKFSHISCLIWLYLAPKSLRMNASAAAVPASVYCRSDTNTSSSTFQSDRRDCRCFFNLLTSRYMKVYHIFIFFCQISRNAAPKLTLTPRTIEFSLSVV